MILVTAAALILFWLRDYWLLQLGPPRAIPSRVWMHAGLLSITGLCAWLLASNRNGARFLADVESPPWLISLFAFHSIAAAACFWMKRTGRYQLAWLAAMIPASAAWVLFARALLLNSRGIDDSAKGAIVSAAVALWILPIVLTLLRGQQFDVRIADLDYVLGFAGWVNWFGAGLVVIAISPGGAESFEVAIRALSPH